MQLLLSNTQYIPHGHCYLWQTPLVALHVVSDAFIAISYYSIPIFLIYFVYQVEELPFKNIIVLFSAFILSCGTTHLLGIWTLWHPDYWLSGIVKAITALISLYTALTLIPLIPKAFKLSSPQHMEILNRQLTQEIVAKENAKQEIEQLNQQLEQRVTEKTAALIKANQDLQESTKFREKLTDLTPNILYIFDLIANSNVYCNRYIIELLGYTPLELQKFKNGLLDELIHPEDLPSVQQHFQNCLTLKKDNYSEIEYRIRDTYGNWHWLHDKNTVFARDADGKPLQIFGVAQDITHNKKIEAKSQRLTQQLEEKIAVLERTNQAKIKLAQMNEFVQACVSIKEAQQILADMLKPLFPNACGAVYLMNNGKDLLDAISIWGDVESDRNFEPKQCWAIRRGDIHYVDSHSPGLYCSHINTTNNTNPSLCVPMIAKGETIGMFYLYFNNSSQIERSLKNLAETVAQNLAMSFANLILQDKLRHQSFRDPLTGLYNRRYLQETLNKEIDRAHRKQQFVSVLMLDVDHFKRFNDVYGHSAGDLVLSTVGSYLLSQIRQYDIACRYGGEELVIVMPDASIEDTVIRAEKIRTGIKAIQLEHEGKILNSITVSIGVSCFPDDSVNPEGLIRAADKALYEAKQQGRDCIKRC